MLRLLIISFLIVLVGCTNPVSEKNILASTTNHTLFKSDVQKLIPNFSDSLDSVQWVHSYVDKWLTEKLLIEKAQFNLPEERLDFSKQLADYKNSLIIHEYEQELVKTFLDTVVSKSEIQSYYDQNAQNFLLVDYLIRPHFIVVRNDIKSKDKNNLKKWLREYNTNKLSELDELCYELEAEYELFDSTWYKYEEFSQSFNFEIKHPSSWLKYNDFIDYQDTSHYYFVKIQDYKLKNELAPLYMVEEKIRKILLHKRKRDLIKSTKKAIFNEAKSQKQFKRFD